MSGFLEDFTEADLLTRLQLAGCCYANKVDDYLTQLEKGGCCNELTLKKIVLLEDIMNYLCKYKLDPSITNTDGITTNYTTNEYNSLAFAEVEELFEFLSEQCECCFEEYGQE